ncbi:MAG: efflux transporter outer membrane subunit, partial [Oxalobacter sp.]|nr:efflux transporter outer membrane subunit [Oxalobacter sp.]
MLKRIPLALLAAGILAGCSMAPTYERPDAPVESQYPTGNSETPSAANRIGWQEFFRDQRLKALIAAAIENNRDLRIAALRIEEARAMYDIQWADRLPTIEVEGTSTRTRTLSNAGPGMVTGGTHQVGVGMPAFELDFFGRVKSLTDAALAKYLATEEAQRSAYISLVSEVAKTYFTERAQAEQIKLASQSYESYLKTLALTKKRYEAGISSAIILRECESLVHAAQVTLANLQREHEKTLNALVVLVGGKMPIGLPEAHKLSEDDLMMDIPEGLPSELLEKRPDIRQHEQLLKAANANIGAARAAFFPRFTLTGFAGTMSTSFSNLFDPHSGAWVFTPQMSVPIFDTGRTIANLDVAEARKNIAV